MVKIGILGQIIGGMWVKYWGDVSPHPPVICSPDCIIIHCMEILYMFILCVYKKIKQLIVELSMQL